MLFDPRYLSIRYFCALCNGSHSLVSSEELMVLRVLPVLAMFIAMESDCRIGCRVRRFMEMEHLFATGCMILSYEWIKKS